jgi:cell division protein FtsN
MAQREHKTRGGSAAKGGNKARGGTLIGIVIGLVLGLLIAVGVAVFLNKGTKPFADKTGRDRPAVAAKGAEKNPPSDPNTPLYGKDARTADNKKDAPTYQVLPSNDKGAPADSKAAPADAKKGTDVATADTSAPAAGGKEQYYLQVGAFGSAGDADNQKAKLALMGFEARVEATEVEGKGTLHRVRIGPYGRLDDINRVRATLAQNGVDASLVKLKDGQK